MRNTNRFLGIAIALFAIIGEGNRLSNFGLVYFNEWLIGSDSDPIMTRAGYVIHHLMVMSIILCGIAMTVFAQKLPPIKLRFLAVVPLVVFLLRPFMWIFFYYIPLDLMEDYSLSENLEYYYVNDTYDGIIKTIATTIGALLLLIVLVVNLVISFIKNGQPTAPDYRNQHFGYQQPAPVQPVYQQPHYVQPPQPPVQQSMIAELAELERMFESGALTKPEFTAAKKRVLGQ